MKIFDCFMYFDEEIVLDVRLNTLDKFVDYFVIVESKFTHKGDKRKLNFNHEKFSKFRDKIIYLIYEESSDKIETVDNKDGEAINSGKYILNAALRENGQRNYIQNGLEEADDNDIILISDVDEIPNLSKINFNQFNQKIILFKQDMFYYKFNLCIPNLRWTGTKACKKKDLVNPQWIRNIKDRKYPFFRLDTYFSDTKYINIKIIENGGWHFSNIKNAEQIKYKLMSYLHHREFDLKPLTTKEIEKIINDKKAIYDLKLDKRVNKIGDGSKLEKFEFNKLPTHIKENYNTYKEWID
jgi:beta-1,4-mannosyl-glycoprotein beta-1,4-N-acetylglucosaminyltransferase